MNQLKAGAALNYVSICLNMVVGLIYTPYMLRMLGQSEYGLYSLAASIIAYLTVLDLGFGNAIVRYTAKFRAEGKQREQEEMFGMFFILYIGIGVIAMIAGSMLSLNVENMFSRAMTDTEVSRTRIMLWLMTFNLAFTFPMSIWGSIMSAYERFVFQRIVSIVRSVLNPVVMILLLVVGYKAVAMVVVTTLFNVATLLVNWWYCKYRLTIKVRFAKFKWGFLKEVSIYSFWIFLNAIMDRIYWSTGQFVLGIYKGSVAIAVYAVAIQLESMYMMFSTAISSVFLPKVTSMVTKGSSDEEISDLFIRTGRIQYIVMAYILSAFVVFGKQFIILWAGDDYADAYYLTLMFFVPLTVPLIQNLGILILQARNQMKFRSMLYIVIALCSLGLSIYLAQIYGGYGCAFATGMALLIGQGLIMNIYYQKKQRINIKVFWWEILKMSIVPAIFIVVGLYALNHFEPSNMTVLDFAKYLILYTVLYIPLFLIFSINKEEKDLLLYPVLLIIRRVVRK
ncbi:oligosaccharide flippase family protein [uncultured Prevotella sp.]|uniref:oligosaccharide flippase family protein n=1 Tax=uncultured Prevotella sp. TaxID=159272 RepID=UPI0026665454|nr:oligosaccharide flippase family protein [uncultured Prevotella sp.]